MRIRSEEGRKVEEAVHSVIIYSRLAGHLQRSKPEEAIKAMPEETRELLQKAKPHHLQDTCMTRQLNNEQHH